MNDPEVTTTASGTPDHRHWTRIAVPARCPLIAVAGRCSLLADAVSCRCPCALALTLQIGNGYGSGNEGPRTSYAKKNRKPRVVR